MTFVLWRDVTITVIHWCMKDYMCMVIHVVINTTYMYHVQKISQKNIKINHIAYIFSIRFETGKSVAKMDQVHWSISTQISELYLWGVHPLSVCLPVPWSDHFCTSLPPQTTLFLHKSSPPNHSVQLNAGEMDMECLSVSSQSYWPRLKTIIISYRYSWK